MNTYSVTSFTNAVAMDGQPSTLYRLHVVTASGASYDVLTSPSLEYVTDLAAALNRAQA